MQMPTFFCDVCGTAKGEATHWFAVQAITETVFTVLPWKEAQETVDLSQREHICGQECLHARLSRWLDLNSFTLSPATEGACQQS